MKKTYLTPHAKPVCLNGSAILRTSDLENKDHTKGTPIVDENEDYDPTETDDIWKRSAS